MSDVSQNRWALTPPVIPCDTGEAQASEGYVLWLTGLSGSGKTTIAYALEKRLSKLGYACFVLDGDRMRRGLSSDLGFSAQDRSENIRRAAEVSKLFSEAGLICITAYISPYQVDRAAARQICGARFSEVYVATDLATCETRDPKGLYKRARAGEIPDFTGVSSPYEAPGAPDLRIDTTQEPLDECVSRLLAHLIDHWAPRQPASRKLPP